MNKKEKSESTSFWYWIIAAIITVVTIFIGLWILNRHWHELPPNAAEFGDSFGMANTLFSALAFAFLIVTALMQRKELELQRKELTDTRKELKKSAIAQEASQQALSSQVSILSKQALLSSYQSMFQANSQIATKGGSVEINQIAAMQNADQFYLKMLSIVEELEEEKKYYYDPFLKQKFQDAAKEFMKYSDSSNKEKK